MLCTQKDRNFYENSQGQIPRTPIRFISSISNRYHKQPQLIIKCANETVTFTVFVRVHIYRENCWKRLWLLNSIIYSLLLDAQNWNSSKWKPRKPKSSNLLIARTKTSHCERKLLRKGRLSCCLIASFIYLNCCFSHFNRNTLCEIEVFSVQIARWVVHQNLKLILKLSH